MKRRLNSSERLAKYIEFLVWLLKVFLEKRLIELAHAVLENPASRKAEMLYYLYMGEYGPAIGGKWGKSEGEKELKPLFRLGQIVGTCSALDAIENAEQNPFELLARHVTGDWGEWRTKIRKRMSYL